MSDWWNLLGISNADLARAMTNPNLLGVDTSMDAVGARQNALLGAYNAIKAPSMKQPYSAQEFFRRASAGEQQDPRVWDSAFAVAGMTAPVGRKALPMDEASRTARMGEQGFNTDLYHGTTFDFPEFQTSPRRKTYLADAPAIANIYAGATNRHTSFGIEPNAGPNVIPLKARIQNPLEVSDIGPDGSHGWFTDNLFKALGKERPEKAGADAYRALFDEARSRGHDFVIMRNYTDLGGNQSQYIPLDLKHVRSRFAAFDPSKIESKDLLAGLLGPVIASRLFGNDDGVK